MGAAILYKCAFCGAENCKLWRQSQTFAGHICLVCGPCALADQKQEGPIDAGGFVYDKDIHQHCDQIGWLVPAVPTPDGETFWGYSSVPPEGVAWWRNLPSYPTTTSKGAA
jgi:DNA-directed RNA polymerase subunit RPC12/RpoP